MTLLGKRYLKGNFESVRAGETKAERSLYAHASSNEQSDLGR
jgi:hypothetical protein